MSKPQPPLAVVVLAAGAGTRMRSSRAKVLHEIGGRSLVAHALGAVREVGAEVEILSLVEGRSTTALIDRIVATATAGDRAGAAQ